MPRRITRSCSRKCPLPPRRKYCCRSKLFGRKKRPAPPPTNPLHHKMPGTLLTCLAPSCSTFLYSSVAMDVCNAGMYEGASARAEAVLLAVRETGRREVLLPRNLHPDYKAVVATHIAEFNTKIIEIPHIDGRLDMNFVRQHLKDSTAA